MLEANLCTYTELISGKVTIRDFFHMLRIADFRHYVSDYAQQHSQSQNQ